MRITILDFGRCIGLKVLEQIRVTIWRLDYILNKLERSEANAWGSQKVNEGDNI